MRILFSFFIFFFFSLSLFISSYNFSLALTCDTGFTAIAGVCVPDSATAGGLSEKTVGEILTNILSWFAGMFAIIATTAFMISGIQFLTSGGNQKIVDTAKRHMWWSIIGVIVGLSGLAIFSAIYEITKASPTF